LFECRKFPNFAIMLATKEDLIQQQILTAAKHLFQVYGLAKVTMDDVANAIGKSRTSLYYYYKSKDEIFDAVINIEIGEMLTAMTQAVTKAVGTASKLRAFCLTKLEVLQEKRAFFKTLDIGMDADTLSHFKQTQIVHHNYIMQQESALLEKLLKEGMKHGELKKVKGTELELLISVFLCALHGLKREMALKNDYEKMEQTIDLFSSMILNGLKA
jgi:AcrR family transcriptional regulator